MKTRFTFAISLAVVFLSALPQTYAEISNTHTPMHALFNKGPKTIKLSLRNNTGAPFELKIDDKISTLREGEVMSLKLPVGTRVIANTATEHHKVGDLILEASNGVYSDATVVINK